ncbi:hypothetical protein SAMN02745165_01242 [Malonomonas rubra DSM 5091]|uniref:Ribbon-helix-helix protein, copG family n=1 Tax=Malonomonas rubra DSM 5091 TaxID=1122189 RepID=A0A1M6FD23_MALRU|nr:hypothetical protein [Malonomonas rubra]SHI95536.1 hypothetical protein SAMN02745165_01242 [Malonomonas rubra DSM 5091]
MGRTCIGSPAKHIVSTRINEEEMQLLQQLADQQDVNISTLLRQSLNLIVEDALSKSQVTLEDAPEGRLFSLTQTRQ